MKFLQELVRFRRMDDEQDDTPSDGVNDDFDVEFADDEFDDIEEPTDNEFADDEFPADDQQMGDDEFSEDLPPEDDEFSDEDMPSEDDEFPPDEEVEDNEPEEPEDPDRAGLIRKVNKAHLVYKRSTDDGSYEEMWTYNVTNLRDEMSVRKAILSGTDIPPNKTQSPDGSQHYELWTAGNAEVMLIKGLPQ